MLGLTNIGVEGKKRGGKKRRKRTKGGEAEKEGREEGRR